ncbi:MAG: hypothetical protein ACOC5R_05220, partial [Elusimicrobiota bacterium]
MKIIKIIYCFVLLSSWSAIGLCQEGLNIGLNARTSSLGGAYDAGIFDIETIYHNPAAISNITKREIGMTSGFSADGWASQNLSYGHPFRYGTLGAGISFDYGNYSDLTGIVGFGFPIFKDSFQKTKVGGAGINLKLIKSSSKDHRSEVISTDVGFLYNLLIRKINFGFSIRNIGTKYEILEKKKKIPLEFVVGFSYRDIADRLSLILNT